MTHSLSARLDLAALTDEELHTLLGPERALALLPEVSRARLNGQALAGPPIEEALTFTPLAGNGPWGAAPEDTRRIARLNQALRDLGAEPHGAYQMGMHGGHHWVLAYTLDDLGVALLRWSEERTVGLQPPYVVLLTWLKNPSVGTACVTSSSAQHLPVPALSEEIDAHLHPELPPAELMTLHRQHVARHGKAQKLAAPDAWLAAWQAVHDLNLRAWRRRGLLVLDPKAVYS